MSSHRDFERQLESLGNQAGMAARYIYADMAIKHAGFKSKKLHDVLNNTPTFWLVCGSAFQSAAYMAIGRIFDDKSRYNVSALLNTALGNIDVFQRPALEIRKRSGTVSKPKWLDDYLANAYYPKPSDFKRIQKKVDEYRLIYERAIKPARNKYLAHREKHDDADVQILFRSGTVKDLWRLSTFLLQLHSILLQLHMNGKKPVLRSVRHSVPRMYDAKKRNNNLPHELMVAEVKTLMEFMEASQVSRPRESSI